MSRVSIRYLVTVFFMATILFTGSSALAAPPDNFTATMVSSGMEMPMARMGAKSRIENPGMQDVVTISLGDVKKTIMMNKVTKTYHEQPIQDREKTPNAYDPEMVIEKKKVGYRYDRRPPVHQIRCGLLPEESILRKSTKPHSGRHRISRISIFKPK